MLNSKKTLSGFACLFMVLLVMGCGSDAVDVEVAPPNEQVKKMLERYAQAGELDSEIVSLREQLEALKATDAAKATELLTDLDQLQSAKGATKIKQIAQQMVNKL